MNTFHDTTTARPDINCFELPITLGGLKLTVGAGTFRNRGTLYELLEDQEYTAEPPDTGTVGVTGYIVREKASGDIQLLVDERVAGDPPYFPEDLFDYILMAFWFAVPAGTTDLDDLYLNIHRIRAKE